MKRRDDNKGLNRREFMTLLGVGAGGIMLGSYAAEATAAKKYDGVKLVCLVQSGVAYEAPLHDLAAEFEQETGAKVEFDSESWGNLMAKIQADLASGVPRYDLFIQNPEFAYTIYPNLLPLNDMIKKANYNMKGFFEPTYKYDVLIGPKPGVRYVLPLRFSTAPIFYRTDLIQAFPTTWKGYENVLAANTGGGRYALSVAGVKVQLVKYFLARYWSQGVQIISPDWKVMINGPEGVKAMEMLKSHVKNYAPPGVLAWDNPDAENAFLAGDAAVVENWGHRILADGDNPEKSAIVGKWGIAGYPEGGTANVSEHCGMIFKTTKHPEVAFEFIGKVCDVKMAKRLVIDYGVHSARKVVWTDPDVVAKRPYMPDFSTVVDRAKLAFPNIPQWLDLFLALGEAASLALAGDMTPKAALDEAADKWKESLALTTFDSQFEG